MPISKKELIKQLKSLKGIRDKEDAHGKADDLLIQYINDPAVTAAYDDVEKWYA